MWVGRRGFCAGEAPPTSVTPGLQGFRSAAWNVLLVSARGLTWPGCPRALCTAPMRSGETLGSGRKPRSPAGRSFGY